MRVFTHHPSNVVQYPKPKPLQPKFPHSVQGPPYQHTRITLAETGISVAAWLLFKKNGGKK